MELLSQGRCVPRRGKTLPWLCAWHLLDKEKTLWSWAVSLGEGKRVLTESWWQRRWPPGQGHLGIAGACRKAQIKGGHSWGSELSGQIQQSLGIPEAVGTLYTHPSQEGVGLSPQASSTLPNPNCPVISLWQPSFLPCPNSLPTHSQSICHPSRFPLWPTNSMALLWGALTTLVNNCNLKWSIFSIGTRAQCYHSSLGWKGIGDGRRCLEGTPGALEGWVELHSCRRGRNSRGSRGCPQTS